MTIRRPSDGGDPEYDATAARVDEFLQHVLRRELPGRRVASLLDEQAGADEVVTDRIQAAAVLFALGDADQVDQRVLTRVGAMDAATESGPRAAVDGGRPDDREVGHLTFSGRARYAHDHAVTVARQAAAAAADAGRERVSHEDVRTVVDATPIDRFSESEHATVGRVLDASPHVNGAAHPRASQLGVLFDHDALVRYQGMVRAWMSSRIGRDGGDQGRGGRSDGVVTF